jgi:hypothetical protein
METVLGNEDLFQEIAGMFLETCSDYVGKIKKGIKRWENFQFSIVDFQFKDHYPK